jgi:hypothetical protein
MWRPGVPFTHAIPALLRGGNPQRSIARHLLLIIHVPCLSRIKCNIYVPRIEPWVRDEGRERPIALKA